MQINMNIDSSELIEAAGKMQLEEKLKLYEKIKSDIIRYRVDELLNKFKNNDITEKEITGIVENVRTERYKNSR